MATDLAEAGDKGEQVMTDISDELRKVADEWDVTPLYALANRVDNEMVKLPKDRDGKPIHIGDTVYAHGFPDGNGGATCEVCSIEFNEGRESRIELDVGGVVTYRTPSSLTHERPDILERIADELDEMKERFRTSDSDTFFALQDLAGRVHTQAKEREHE